MAIVRQRIASSPHRSVAVLPLDLAPGQKNLSQPAADFMETKMRRLGFVLADRQKVLNLYNHSKIKNRTFDALNDAAELGRQLGVQAVLVGLIDQSYEHTIKRPAEYDTIANPIPACCNRASNPCPSRLVYDPVVQAYVDSCGPTHQKMLTSAAATIHSAGLSVRVRLVDVGTRNVFWESAEQMHSDDLSLLNEADQATDTFADRIIEDFMKQGL
jgi:hypothetical protein